VNLVELIRYLVEDLNYSSSIEEESPLVIAERSRNDYVVMYLVEKLPWILDSKSSSEIRSSVQDLSLNSGNKDISGILYEGFTSTSENTENKNPSTTGEENIIWNTHSENT